MDKKKEVGEGLVGGCFGSVRKSSKEDFKDHFSKVSADRFENSPEEIEETVKAGGGFTE